MKLVRRSCEEPRLLGPGDQQLLRKRHTIQAQLHAQVATSHHEGLGLGDDAVDVGQSLRVIRQPGLKTMAAGSACFFGGCALCPLACHVGQRLLFSTL